MDTHDLLNHDHVHGLTDEEKRARIKLAVRQFSKLQPTLTAYARALTGNRSVRVLPHATNNGATDGKNIYYRPPIGLANPQVHDRRVCDKRDPNSYQQLCAACAIREQVLVTIYHEIAHISGGTFEKVSERVLADITTAGVRSTESGWAKAVLKRIEEASYAMKNEYMPLAHLISEWHPILLNAIEDARVNARMYGARPGTRRMMNAMLYRIFNEGVEQINPLSGEVVVIEWRNYGLNMQAMIGVFCIASGYEVDEWLDESVVESLADPKLRKLIAQVGSLRNVSGSYRLTFPVLARLRELGYCLLPADPPEEELSEHKPPKAGENKESSDATDDVDSEPDDVGSESNDGDLEPDQDEPVSDDESDREANQDRTEESDDEAGGSDDPTAREDESSPQSANESEADDSNDGPADSDNAGSDDEDGDEGEAAPDEDGANGQPDSEGGPGDPTGDGDSPKSDGDSGRDEHGDDSAASDSDSGSEADSSDSFDESLGGSDSEDGLSEPEGSPSDAEGGSGDGDSGPASAPGNDQLGEDTGDERTDSSDSPEGTGVSDSNPLGEGSNNDGHLSGSESGPGSGPEGSNDSAAKSQTDGSSPGADSSHDSSASETPGGGDAEGCQEESTEGTDSGAEGEPLKATEKEGLKSGRPQTETEWETYVVEYGTPEETKEALRKIGDHEHSHEHEPASLPDEEASVEEASAEEANTPSPYANLSFDDEDDDDEALGSEEFTDNEEDTVRKYSKVIIQGRFFDTESTRVYGIREHHFGTTTLSEDGRETSGGWGNGSRGSHDTYERLSFGVDSPDGFDVPESTLGSALLRLRTALSDNARGGVTKHLKSGKINPRVLGRRAPLKDPRIFEKKSRVSRKSYFVLIGIDISGSTVGENLALAKRAALAQAEMCHRLGVEFEIFAHTSNIHDRRSYSDGHDVEIYFIKEAREPWTKDQIHRLKELHPDEGNLDGHTVEYYRKRAERSRATEKIIMYYTDGAMPASNYEEELEVLQREIGTCKKLGIHLMGVGIRTNSPEGHGLSTVQVDEDTDIINVVRHLEKRLLGR